MNDLSKVGLIVSTCFLIAGVMGFFLFSGLFKGEGKDFLARLALIVSVLAAILGIFGGFPGIKALFFSKPSIVLYSMIPVVVFDEGYTLDSTHPKFSLKGIIKIHNPNNFDISIREMRLYGRTQDTSGKYKFPGNKPILYELTLSGILDSKEDIIKAHADSLLQFHFAHFENTEEPGVMRGPMVAKPSTEHGHHIFHIYVPLFNQLFFYNEKRSPSMLLDESKNANLTFAVLFNDELVKAPSILPLQHMSIVEWGKTDHLVQIYNAVVNINEVTKR